MKPGQPFVEIFKASVVEEFFTTQTEDEGEVHGDASADHFRGVTKMVGPGNSRRRHHDRR